MRLVQWVAALVALVVSAPAFAQKKEIDPVDQVLAFFHVKEQLAEASALVNDTVTHRKKELNLSEADTQKILTLGHRIFPARNLLPIFRATYAKQMELDEVEQVLVFMAKPVAVQYSQGLATAYQDSRKQRQAYLDKAGADVLRPNRENALRTFIGEWQLDQAAACMHSGVGFGIDMGLNMLKPEVARISTHDLRERSARWRGSYLDDARRELMAFDLYALKSMKNADVDELSAFADTAAGRAHNRAVVRAIEEALDKAGLTIAQQMLKAGK